jgi:hypothetical protein
MPPNLARLEIAALLFGLPEHGRDHAAISVAVEEPQSVGLQKHRGQCGRIKGLAEKTTDGVRLVSV